MPRRVNHIITDIKIVEQNYLCAAEGCPNIITVWSTQPQVRSGPVYCQNHEHLADQSHCLYCGAAAENGWAEVDHMNAKHPEVVAQRLRNAGYHQHPITGEWVG